MALKYDTLLTNCGFIVGFVSKYIPFLLNITFQQNNPPIISNVTNKAYLPLSNM